jgi:hypothetical protein
MAQATFSTGSRSHLVPAPAVYRYSLQLPCELERPNTAPAHPCACGVPFILNIKTARVIFLDIPSRPADLSPPANASLLLKVQHFPVFSQILLLTKLWSSMPVSSLDEHTIANIG